MTIQPVRAGPEWLRLREPADAASRSHELVAQVLPGLPARGGIVIHDLGCGSGSMARWLAGQLPGPQQWILYDRDEELLALAAADPPGPASDGAPVVSETRHADITRLGPAELAGATLVTASALIDMLTGQELERLVDACAGAGCPVLIALSVTGRVELTPSDPLDGYVAEAFNAHQRRVTGAGRLLGPAAAPAAVAGLTRLGMDVRVRPSPWRLGQAQSELTAQWFAGWLAAACDQRPELGEIAGEYSARRVAEAAAGRLAVTVQHQDLLALPG